MSPLLRSPDRYDTGMPRGIFARYSLIFLCLTAAAVCRLPFTQDAEAAKPLKVVVLTDAAGLGDKGFNDVCWKGVQKAKEELELNAQFLQSREQADYVANLTLATQYADVVITLGFLYTDAVRQVVERFPQTRFIHIEGDVTGPNVASFDFKSEEGGYLGGLVAGLFTKAGKVGIVSGMDIPPVEAYISGFQAGIKTAEKQRGIPVECIVASAGSFNDPVKGKSLALALMEKGADVIFRAAGNTGIGVLEAVKDAKGVYLIAEDLDMDSEFPGKILVSLLKRMDVAIHDAILNLSQGRFQSGHHWLGVAEGGIGMSEMNYSRPLFTPADLEKITKARQLLKDGRITVPSRYSRVDSFQVPDL